MKLLSVIGAVSLGVLMVGVGSPVLGENSKKEKAETKQSDSKSAEPSKAKEVVRRISKADAPVVHSSSDTAKDRAASENKKEQAREKDRAHEINKKKAKEPPSEP